MIASTEANNNADTFTLLDVKARDEKGKTDVGLNSSL